MCANFLMKILEADQQRLLEWLDVMFGTVEKPVWVNPGEMKRGQSDKYPGYEVPVVTLNNNGQREWSEYRWGFLPKWAPSEKHRPAPFNAVGEELSAKPMFKSAFKTHRCLIPANGFYDYKASDPEGAKGRYLFKVTGQDYFAFPGLWEEWHNEIRSCAIVTTEPNALMKQFHHRMPVILNRDEHEQWLNPKATEAEL